MTTQISGDTGVSQCQPNSVSQDDLQAGARGVGVGQTWQDMEGSRALATVYTNTTGQPITINVSAISTLETIMTATVAGVLLQGAANGIATGRGSIMAVVPAGATYRADMSGTTSSITWKELR